MRPLVTDAGIRERPRLHAQRWPHSPWRPHLLVRAGTAGGPASVCRNRGASSKVSVASLSPRAPATPASAETAWFLPHPIPPGRTRCPERGSPGAQCRQLWTDCDPSLGSSVRLLHFPGNPPSHPAPHHPASVLDQEGPEMRGVHPRRSLSIGHSGISPALSKTVIIPEGDAGTMDPTLSLEGGGTQAFVSWRGYPGTKTPALWQAGGRHRGLHAGRLRSTGNHPLPQSWGPHV